MEMIYSKMEISQNALRSTLNIILEAQMALGTEPNLFMAQAECT